MERECGNCRFWHNRPFEDVELGQCRRLPPAMSDYVLKEQTKSGVGLEEAHWVATRFPTTIQTEWCGEWKGGAKVLDDLDPDVVERHLLEIRERMAKHDDGHITDD